MRIFVILISLFIGLFNVSSQQKISSVTLPDGQVVKVVYVSYDQNTKAIKEYKLVNGQSVDLTLPTGQVVKVKEVRYHPLDDYVLEYAKFFKTEPIPLSGGQVVKATDIRFDQDGRIDYVVFDHVIELPDGQKVKVSRVKNDFNGNLSGYVLPEKAQITIPNGQKVPATFVSYYPGTKAMKTIDLDSTAVIKLADGQTVNLSSISYFEDGTINSLKTLTSTNAEIKLKLPNGMNVTATDITYYKGNIIENITFPNKVKIELAPGITANVRILYFYNNGKIKEAILASKEQLELTLNNKPIVATYKVSFDDDGNIIDAE
jgi:hypothetical protein